MASESDSLRASSTTGEVFTPITSSTSDDSAAATAGSAHVHRVGMTRQSAAASVPVQPSVSITFDIPERRGPLVHHKSKATGGDKSPSPKRNLEEYKPTVARDDNGFLIYYDASLSTKWRNLKNGQSARAPFDHRPGGKYFSLPLPPNYIALVQREQLKAGQSWANQKAALKGMKAREAKTSRVYSEPVNETAMSPASPSGPATAALPRGRPPLTPRKGRSVERRVSKSPSNGPLKQTKQVSVERLLVEMKEVHSTTVNKLKKYRSASWGTETTRISTLLSGEDQRMVDKVFARSTFEKNGFNDMQNE